eukprot:g16035.t1
MEGRRDSWSGGGGSGTGSRGTVSAERARLQALATEFKGLLGEAAKSASVPGSTNSYVPEPKHFWLVPILHRLADIAERLEASYCRQPGVNAFDNRRFQHPIGQAIRLATLGSLDNDRYSQPTRFISDVLFGLLRTGGGLGGGALVLAPVCRFLCAVSNAPADQGSRSAPPPPVSTLLNEDLELYEVVLSWARGESPPAAGGGAGAAAGHSGFDAAAAQAAMEKGRETVRVQTAAANPAEVQGGGGVGNSAAPGGGKGKEKAKPSGAGKSPTAGTAAAADIVAEGGSGSGSGGGGGSPKGAGGATAAGGASGDSRATGHGVGESVTGGDACSPEEPTVAEAIADHATAAAELRAHATGLVGAGLISRQLSDVIVNTGFAAHLVHRLREGPVADHLRAEAARERGKSTLAGGRGRSLAVAGAPRAAGVAPSTSGGADPLSPSSAVGGGVGDGGATAGAAPGRPYGRWASVAALEAVHVASCISGIGGYQEILAPLFGGDGLAVVDLLLENPELEVRYHAVELLSALLVHKKVGLAFVRRGWVKTVLRLGSLEDGTFLEPEVGFCLHAVATSGGVMEAVCRVQDGSLERLLAYAASLLRSPSESTQRNAMLFWEAAMRFPPALEAFDHHGGVSKLLYLLLPSTQGSVPPGAAATGRAGGNGTRASAVGARGSSNGEESSPLRQRSRWWHGTGGGGGGSSMAELMGAGREPSGSFNSAAAVQHRRAQVTLGACSCLRQYLRCSLALAALKQQQRCAAMAHVSRQQGRSGGGGGGSARGGGSGSGASSAAAVPTASYTTLGSPPSPSQPQPRTPGRPAWQCKPLAVDDASHAAHVAAVKGREGLGNGDGRTAAGGRAGAGAGAGGSATARDRDAITVRLGMHWAPAMQLMHHRGMQALINVVDAMLSQRTMGADTALHALDALATAALCPMVYPELCRPGSNNSAGGATSGDVIHQPSSSTPSRGSGGTGVGSPPSQPSLPGGTANASGGAAGERDGGSRAASGRSRSARGRDGSGGGDGSGSARGSGRRSPGVPTAASPRSIPPRNRLGVDVLLDAAGGIRQKDPGVMCAALKVLETCCRPHKGCGPLVPSSGAAAASSTTAAGRRPLAAGHGHYGGTVAVPASSAAVAVASTGATTPSAAAGEGRGAGQGLKRSLTGESPAGAVGAHRDGTVRSGGGCGPETGGSGSGHNAVGGGGPGACANGGFCRDDDGGGGGGCGGSDRVVDDRLQRPMRKLVRERNGIRVLVGLLRYRRQVSMADAVRLRATLCLLGLAHDVQIAQVLEKMRITTTLSDTVRGGPVVDRNVESYSQLREAAKQIIAKVAGRLSGVRLSGLMDPAVTGLERAAVVANTPITFRPRELLGIIHEYLAANGLAGAANALAAEAGISPHRLNVPGAFGEGPTNDQAWGAQVLDVETGTLLAKLWDARSRPLYPLPNVGFNATDDLVVTDGALWDPRRGLRVYQFDKLGGGSGFGLFHPNGNEVLVDEGVWDLRTHRLLRTLPVQDGTVMKPDPGGDVLYTYRPAPAGEFFDVPSKRAAQDTCFGVLDSSTYEQIHSHDTEKAVIQLSTDDWGGDGSYISVVERADPLLNSADTVCSLYEIGRKRPDEADSDLDDAMTEDSDEEWEDADHSDGVNSEDSEDSDDDSENDGSGEEEDEEDDGEDEDEDEDEDEEEEEEEA